MSGSFTIIEMHILDFDEDIYDLPLRFTSPPARRVHSPSLKAVKWRLEAEREEFRLYNPLFFRSFAMNVPE